MKRAYTSVESRSHASYSTSSPFAIVLYFYEKYFPFKLQEKTDDLMKIIQKYQKKPTQLIKDLRKKYENNDNIESFGVKIVIPDEIDTYQLSRIFAQYPNIPIGFKTFVLEEIEQLYNFAHIQFRKKDDILPVYDPRLDYLSASFDADYALFNTKSLLVDTSKHNERDNPFTHQIAVDNLSKVMQLIPTHLHKELDYSLVVNRVPVMESFSSVNNNASEVSQIQRSISEPAMYITEHSSSSSSSSVGTKVVSNETNESSKPFLIQLAEESIYLSFRNSKKDQPQVPGPMKLLYDCMRSNDRVRIIIRKRSGLRGSIDGYIKTFDRHFNLFLTDADEHYITNNTKKRIMKMGKFVDQRSVHHRHLPQLLIRGDIVVAVFRVPYQK